MGGIPGVSGRLSGIYRLSCVAWTHYGGRCHTLPELFCNGGQSGVCNRYLLPTIAKGIESVNSIGEVLLSEDVEQNEGKKQLEDVTGTFDFEDVSFHYKNSDKPVLNHLNLHVKQGETIALVGESGAGKSTVLNLVSAFIWRTEGRSF